MFGVSSGLLVELGLRIGCAHIRVPISKIGVGLSWSSRQPISSSVLRRGCVSSSDALSGFAIARQSQVETPNQSPDATASGAPV